MQKLTGKYLFFKTVIHLLFLLMTLVFSIPAVYLFKSGDNSVSLTVRCVSSLSFVVLALFWHYVIRRSNLSKISKGAYLAGELLPITFWTVVGNLILYIPSGSLVPPEPKWYAYLFFPFSACSYLTNNLLLGSLLQILLCALTLFLLYGLKKRKDPSLSGSLSQTVLSAEVSETEAQAEEDAEGTGAKENGAEEMTEESEEKEEEEEENKKEGENGRHD